MKNSVISIPSHGTMQSTNISHAAIKCTRTSSNIALSVTNNNRMYRGTFPQIWAVTTV